jgi:hypothetical protein
MGVASAGPGWDGPPNSSKFLLELDGLKNRNQEIPFR